MVIYVNRKSEDEFITGLAYGIAITIITSLVLVVLVGHGYIQLSQGYTGLAEGALIVIGVTWGTGLLVSLRVKSSKTKFIAGVIAGTILVVIIAVVILAILGSTSKREGEE